MKGCKRFIFLICLLCAWISVALAMDKEELKELHTHGIEIILHANAKIPENFPLEKDGTMGCETCHGLKNMAQLEFEVIDPDGPDFFREGPYEKLSDFCFRCHQSLEYKGSNIHKMINADGSLNRSNCIQCHIKTPDPETTQNSIPAEFRLTQDKLCFGCHGNTPHINANNHLVKVSIDMKATIKKSEQENDIILPLWQGKITCVTCHSAHEIGVIPQSHPSGKQVSDVHLQDGIQYEDSDWVSVFNEDKRERFKKYVQINGYRMTHTYQRIKSEVLLRLPAKNGALCLACHRFER
ncbi:MAG: hypothetical protein GY786_10765 [Proteobacteria bacterium]|nr:hypothetical protein [Pseudomonadota bacterium]